MRYGITDKQRIWLGIVSAIGTFGSVVPNIFISVNEMLRHHEFHISALLSDLPMIALWCLPFWLFTVYIFFFSKKNIKHRLLSTGYALFGISSLIIALLTVALYFYDSFYVTAVNLLVPINAVSNFIENGDITAFLLNLFDTVRFYNLILCVIFAVLAVNAIRKDFKRIKTVKALAIAVIISHFLLGLIGIPSDIELIAEGFYDSLIITHSYFLASVPFLLFWVLLKPVSADDIAPTFILSDTAKAELSEAQQQLDLGVISQEDFQKKKAEILEKM